jgi:hypothetical protein
MPTVIVSLPFAANSGQYRATGASGSRRPAAMSWFAAIAVMPFVHEKMMTIVSEVQGRFVAGSATPPHRSTTGRPAA